MAQLSAGGVPPTPAWRDARGRPPGTRALSLALSLLLLVPPLVLALWGGFEILRNAHAPWQWPWGVFFLAVAACPLLIALGRRGLRESDAPGEQR